MERPAAATDDVLVFLDRLRESGATNMFGAGQYLREVLDMNRKDASEALSYWMETFSDRHPKAPL